MSLFIPFPIRIPIRIHFRCDKWHVLLCASSVSDWEDYIVSLSVEAHVTQCCRNSMKSNETKMISKEKMCFKGMPKINGERIRLRGQLMAAFNAHQMPLVGVSTPRT